MDGNLLTFIHVLLFLSLRGGVFACREAEQFNTECLTPYRQYAEQGVDAFWTNLCSAEGRKVFSCFITQYEGNCGPETEQEVDFNTLFENFNFDIDFACEYMTKNVCKTINDCFPSRIYEFSGSTVYNFYDYFCGDQYLNHMFTCTGDLEPICPNTTQYRESLFWFTTRSGPLYYDELSSKLLFECGKLLDSDVECIRVKTEELAACGIDPNINIPESVISCTHSDQSKSCVTERCGSTVANFFDEVFTFLQCGQNIDGGWGNWGPWSECNPTCGDGQGVYFRSRRCNNPPPSENGAPCNGSSIDVGECTLTGCPVDGEFSIWGLWSACTVTCGGGTRTRSRQCNSPEPANGGNNCTGDFSQTTSCNILGCPVDGMYSTWGTWGSCTGTQDCGPGLQTRTRTCDNPPPSNGGSNCIGSSTDQQVCYQQECPVDGGYSEWGAWTVCSVTCGGGTRVRSRACDNPTPANGGSGCSGDTRQIQACNERVCPVTSCSEITDSYGTWVTTIMGLVSTLSCRRAEEEGSYSRRCGVDGVWGAVTGECQIKAEVFEELNNQLEELSDTEGDVSEALENIVKNLTDLTDSVDSGTGGQTLEGIVGTARLFVIVIESRKTVTEAGTQSFFEMMSNIINPDTETVWNEENTDVKGSDVFELIDRYLAVLQDTQCDTLGTGEISSYDNTNLYTEVGKLQGDVKYPGLKQADSYIEIPAATLSNKGITEVCYGGSSYTSVGNIVEKDFLTADGSTTSFANGQVINSAVVSIQLPNILGVTYSDLDPPVRVIFKPINKTLIKPVCVFWDSSVKESDKNGAWSSAGCQAIDVTDEQITCACSHLTNFAILMSTSEISDKHTRILSIISAVGSAISMVCLVLTLAVHALVWKLVRSDRAIILMNLCVAFLLALGVFLAGVNRTESPKACAAIAAIIQLLFLAVFFFMLLIGLEILICVVHVFVTKFRIKILLPVAWLAPVLIVGISLGVTKAEGYGNDRFCWLDIDSGLIWSFIGPAAAVILVNFIIIVIVFKKMASSSVLKSKSTAMKIQTGVRSLCVLLPLMGLTWLFGLLSVNSSFLFFQYLFCICNTLQGLFIFLFHCVFNRQVRDAIKRRQDRRRSLQTFSSDFRKQSRSSSKDVTQKSPISDPVSSDSKKTGIDNKAYAWRNKRARSEGYRPDDWDKLEIKKFHKDIRRGSKLDD